MYFSGTKKDLSNKNYDLSSPSSFLGSLSDSLSESGGSSGVLYSIFFSAASTSFAKHRRWHKSFLDGTHAIMKHGGASVGDRTMVDSLFPAANALNADTVSALKRAVDVASDGARQTASIVILLYAARPALAINCESWKCGVPS